MSLLQPRANVPIGWVTVGGARLPVFINPPWQRTFADVPGAIADSVSVSQPPVVFEDGGGHDELMFIPPPPAAAVAQTQVLMLVNEEYVGDDCFWPPR